MAEVSAGGHCAGCYIRRGLRDSAAETVYQGTQLCWDCLDAVVTDGWNMAIEIEGSIYRSKQT